MQTSPRDSALAVVLAAGKGTRMQSELPKVLFPVCGRPMIEYVLEALDRAGVKRKIVVVGYRADLVRESLRKFSDVEFVEQTQQLGTGHAVKMCRERLAGHHGPALVLAGDSPLVQSDSLVTLLSEFERLHPACLLGTLHKANPAGLGRIVRNAAGAFVGIVEQKDATPEQLAITEVNMSTYVFDAQPLVAALDRLECKNAQGEYYLTDCPGLLLRQGLAVQALPVLKACESLSINNLDELAAVETEMRRLNKA